MLHQLLQHPDLRLCASSVGGSIRSSSYKAVSIYCELEEQLRSIPRNSALIWVNYCRPPFLAVSQTIDVVEGVLKGARGEIAEYKKRIRLYSPEAFCFCRG
jgi:hypothetical protein